MAKIELTTAEQETLNGIATTLAPPVLTEYPTTDASKAGQRFIYKGNEWHYMTQAEIDSTGWNGLVDVGFPAPVSRLFNTSILYTDISPNLQLGLGATGLTIISGVQSTYLVDILGLGIPHKCRSVTFGFGGPSEFAPIITGFLNVSLLSELEDRGTQVQGARLSNGNLTTEVIDSFFTQLPPTIKTATIKVSNNPGSATCDPTIATAKGYTVIT